MTSTDHCGASALDAARDLVPLLRKQAAANDEAARFPVESLAALRGSGLLGLLVPTAYGGLGGTLTDMSSVARELAAGCLSTAMIWTMHCQQVAVLAHSGSEALRDRLLPRVADGRAYLASVTSERGTGGHLLTALAPITRGTGGLTIRREAPIVTGGAHADGFLITMRDNEDAPEGAVSLVYADRDQLEIEQQDNWNPLGMRATHSVAMDLSGTVPADQMVGAAGGFRDAVVSTFVPVGHVGWAAAWLGAARGVLREVLSMLREPSRRKEFDLRSELLLDRVARIRLELDTVNALLRQVVAEVEAAWATGADLGAVAPQLRINGLKVHAAEALPRAVTQLMELVGLRHGYLRSSPIPIERVFRDLRSASLNYSNDRLTTANGVLALLDWEVTLD